MNVQSFHINTKVLFICQQIWMIHYKKKGNQKALIMSKSFEFHEYTPLRAITLHCKQFMQRGIKPFWKFKHLQHQIGFVFPRAIFHTSYNFFFNSVDQNSKVIRMVICTLILVCSLLHLVEIDNILKNIFADSDFSFQYFLK